MSAVSSESQLAAADLSEPSAHPSSQAQAGADFGANEWLVDELYQRYLADPGSVDKAWWSFFADYRPVMGTATPSAPEAADAQADGAAPPLPPPPATTTAAIPTASAARIGAARPSSQFRLRMTANTPPPAERSAEWGRGCACCARWAC